MRIRITIRTSMGMETSRTCTYLSFSIYLILKFGYHSYSYPYLINVGFSMKIGCSLGTGPHNIG